MKMISQIDLRFWQKLKPTFFGYIRKFEGEIDGFWRIFVRFLANVIDFVQTFLEKSSKIQKCSPPWNLRKYLKSLDLVFSKIE